MALSRNVLALLVVAFAFYCAQSAFLFSEEKDTRLNLILGTLGSNDVLLYSTVSSRNATVGASGINDVVYRGFAVNITYITAIESGLTQNATAFLLSGGLGAANATVRLTSAVSRGFNYTVNIYGR